MGTSFRRGGFPWMENGGIGVRIEFFLYEIYKKITSIYEKIDVIFRTN